MRKNSQGPGLQQCCCRFQGSHKINKKLGHIASDKSGAMKNSSFTSKGEGETKNNNCSKGSRRHMRLQKPELRCCQGEMETWMQACKSTPVTRSASARFKLHFNLFVFNFNNLSRIVLRCPCVTTITIKSDHESLLLFYAPHEHQISTWT